MIISYKIVSYFTVLNINVLQLYGIKYSFWIQKIFKYTYLNHRCESNKKYNSVVKAFNYAQREGVLVV